MVAQQAILSLFLAIGFSAPAAADAVSIEGLEWRQLTDTAGAGLTWNDVASVCPLDETPCQGSVKGVDFTGWTWASAERVEGLLDVMTGLSVPTATDFESPLALFYDQFDAVYVTPSVQLSYGFTAQNLDADSVPVFEIQDARASAGFDRIEPEEVLATDTEISGGFFGPQPIGVFLVRDPDLELCGNGIDDDGDGAADGADDDCVAANPVVNGVEWRQPAATTGFAYWDMLSVCPNRGEPCTGSLSGIDFSGWTWASFAEVQALLETVTGRTISTELPYDDDFTAPFFGLFTPTSENDQVRDVRAQANDAIGEAALADGSEDPASCFNGIDDDGDGEIDEADADCGSAIWLLVRDSFDPAIRDSLRSFVRNPSRGSDTIGFFLYREPVFTVSEVCDNTFDDDGDGLVDDADVDDCRITDPVGLQVRCVQDPIYVAEAGEVVTIRAEAIDREGRPVEADSVEIRLGFDKATPQAAAESASTVTLEYPAGGDFSYACGATRGLEGDGSGWRTVRVGEFDADFPAVPLLYNGRLDEKIDIVFFPDRDEYTGWDDPNFLDDVTWLIHGGFFSLPAFVESQDSFNFWVGRTPANTGPDPDADDPPNDPCLREKPANFKRDYSFADSAGFVHRSVCRDNAGSPGTFTAEVDARRLVVVAHEMGHRPFGLADEYPGDGGYYTRRLFDPPYPNLFRREAGCRNKAEKRGYDPDSCRSLRDTERNRDWWLFEPNYRAATPQPFDLMQQSGCDSLESLPNCSSTDPDLTGVDADPNGIVACAFPLDVYRGDPDGIPGNDDETHWLCRRAGPATAAIWTRLDSNNRAPLFERYDVGRSEFDRVRWLLQECAAGRC